MKRVFLSLLFFFLLWTPAHANDFAYQPEDCTTTTDDDGDGTINQAAVCDPEIPAFSAQTGTDIAARFEDCVLVNLTVAADAISSTGNSVSRTAGANVNQAQAKCAGNATGDYYFWVQSYGDTTQSGLWADTTALGIYPSNASLGSALIRRSTPDWQQICSAGSNVNFANGTNADCTRTFTLAGDFNVFSRGRNGVTFTCLFGSTSSSASPQCPSGPPTPTADYVFLKTTNTITMNHADLTNANSMVLQNDSSGLSYVVKGLWKAGTPARGYLQVECTNCTSYTTVSTTEDSFSTGESNIDFRWRTTMDLNQVFDADMRMVVGNLQPVCADADWSGAINARTFTPDFNSSCNASIVASTSWKAFIAFDIGTVADGNKALANLGIRSKFSGVNTTIAHLKGTTTSALVNANEFGIVEFSGTPVSGSLPTPPVAGNLSFAKIGASSFFVTWDFDTGSTGDGTCKVKYDTTTGLQGTESVTPSQASSGGSCTVLVSGLAPATTYYLYGNSTDGSGQTDDSTQGSQATSTNDATLFVSASGSGNCLTIATPCAFGTVWALAGPGSVIEAAAGTYQGSTRMIAPNVAGLGGTAANPITVRCATDGACAIDGQGARVPIKLANNDYFIIDGFNAYNSSAEVVLLSTGADNNIIRRVVAWDADQDTNVMVFAVHGNTGNLLEDVAGFGKGRKIFTNSQGGNNLTIRRAWGRFENTLRTGPAMAFSSVYSSFNGTYENVIGTWSTDPGISITEPFGMLSMDGNSASNYCANSKYLGSLSYLRAADTNGGLSTAGAYGSRATDCFEFKDVVSYIEPGSYLTTKPFYGQLFDGGSGVGATCPSCDRHFTNITEVGGAASSFNTSTPNGWVITNRGDYASIAAMNTASANPFQTGTGTGARMCFQYQNGTLTSTKLWPWPMDSRINAALTASGRTPSNYFAGSGNTVTSQMESIFGTIPAGCKEP